MFGVFIQDVDAKTATHNDEMIDICIWIKNVPFSTYKSCKEQVAGDRRLQDLHCVEKYIGNIFKVKMFSYIDYFYSKGS